MNSILYGASQSPINAEWAPYKSKAVSTCYLNRDGFYLFTDFKYTDVYLGYFRQSSSHSYFQLFYKNAHLGFS